MDKNNSKKYSNNCQKTDNELKDEITHTGLNYESPTKEEDPQSRKVWCQRIIDIPAQRTLTFCIRRRKTTKYGR